MKKNTLLPLSIAVAAAVSSPMTLADDSLTFSGYARYGMAYQSGDSELVDVDGQLNARSVGRLGNEYNGGEFQLSKGFEGPNGTEWDVVVMLNHWNATDWGSAGDVDLVKAYAAGKNIFKSQPDMVVWAGRDFHQRPQTGLNDYFWMSHDSQGGGFKNLNLGGAKLDFAAVGQVANGDSGSLGDDSGKYAITSKLHDIALGESASLNLYANYGFASEAAKGEAYEDTAAYQLAGELNFSGQRFILRYSDNAQNAVFDLAEGRTALLASFDGSTSLSERAAVEYLAAYQKLEEDSDSSEDRANYNVIVRPTYSWNDIHSTWVEAGYSVVDYDNDDKNSAWKVTFSQNMSIGKETWDRPMLRFYATVGEADNKTADTKVDTFTVGAMWEAWW
ncbi:carbohydrate porin [Vibrio hannami]|uniref:carbohydrate porin n=1 Tax=Vibrio hannami TaxID=2717094 RepID=UPI0024109CD3|nr:carbohydrate porin [Vibrio hannami]MDG3085689.1 carbohydrate porin [Vibrio hannami]